MQVLNRIRILPRQEGCRESAEVLLRIAEPSPPAIDLEQPHGSPDVFQVRVHLWERQTEDARGKPTTSPQLAKSKGEQTKLNQQENNQHKEHPSLMSPLEQLHT